MPARRAVLLALAGALAPLAAQPPPSEKLRVLWNEFAALANKWSQSQANGVFNYAIAEELSRAWRRIEASGDWPAYKQ